MAVGEYLGDAGKQRVEERGAARRRLGCDRTLHLDGVQRQPQEGARILGQSTARTSPSGEPGGEPDRGRHAEVRSATRASERL
jgi:hypothetical protein